MFGWLKEKKEERKKRKAEQRKVWEEKLLNSRKVSFCLQDVEFMDYALPFHLAACGNELSLYEITEKSYNEEVVEVFREIAEELSGGYHVLQWLYGSAADTVSKDGMLIAEHTVVKCSENGLDSNMMDLQMSEENHWKFAEQECYCYRRKTNSFAAVEDAAEYIENVPCDLYIMIDLMHGALMVKTGNVEDLKKAEKCMRRVCVKYEKEIHDYIGHLK